MAVSVNLSPLGNQQLVDESGNPAVGWYIETYAAGSSTRLATYTDETGTATQSANVTMNALGLPEIGKIWLIAGRPYKFKLYNAVGVLKDTADSITGVNDALANQWLPSNLAPTYINATTFTLSGDQTTDFHAQRKLQFTTTAGNVYGEIATSVYGTLTTVTMTMDGTSVLDSGLSAVNLSLLRADHLASPGGTGTFIQSGTGAVFRTPQNKLRESVSIEDFLPAGYVTDGTVDYSTQFQVAIDALSAAGGGKIYCPHIYYIASSIEIKNNVRLFGDYRNPEVAISGSAFSLSGRQSRIILNPLATITARNSSSVDGLIINRLGLVTGEDPTTWTGTAITSHGAGVFLGDLAILGFNKAIVANSNTAGERSARSHFARILFDCNYGISASYCYDIIYLSECHGNNVTGTSSNLRSGIAFEFADDVDWGKITNCFSYGYAKGFRIFNADDVTLIGCGTDYVPTGTSTSIGYEISGTSNNANLIGCQSAAQGTAVYVDNGTAATPSTRITGCSFWDNDTYGVRAVTGGATVSACSFKGGAKGVDAESGSLGVAVTGNTFNAVATPITLATAAFDLSQAWNNRYINCADATVGLLQTFDSQRDLITLRSWSSAAAGARYTFDKARGSAAAPALPNNTDATIDFFGRGWTGTTWANSAQLRAQFDGAPSATSMAGRFIFSVTPTGSTTLVDRISIAQSGNLNPVTDNSISCGESGLTWSNNYSRNFRPGTGAVIWTSGAGTPEAVVTAPVGSLYTRTDGGAVTTLYVKESGAGNTGWVAK